MIELQFINKLLGESDLTLVTKNGIEPKMFHQFREEFEFIISHYKKYSKIPDSQTMVNQFNHFEIFGVSESYNYLINGLIENHNFYELLDIMKDTRELLEIDSNEAIELIKQRLPRLKTNYNISGTDLTKDFTRLTTVKDKLDGKSSVIKTGLKELDEIVYGFMPGEELVTVVARTGQGKTWLLMLFLVNAWLQGKRVGIYSGEMTDIKIGYRMDTLINHFSNKDLVRGTIQDINSYENYLEELQNNNNPFYVITTKDLGGRATVSQLEAFIEENDLDILGVDQFTLMRDERSGKFSSSREQLEHISGDLFDLSIKKGIPIVVLSQANRGGVKDDDKGGTPDIENIYGADAIAQNSTKVLSIRQTGAGLEIGIKKNRDDKAGDTLLYYWDIDNGIFKYLPSNNNYNDMQSGKVEKIRQKYQDKEDVF